MPGEPSVHAASSPPVLERVRHVRVEMRLPTPPDPALAFYAVALLAGMAIGAFLTLALGITA
jgi:hypothetical protein